MPRLLSYANVASTLALVLALSGTAYAAATITGRDVVDGSLKGRDIRDGSLTSVDVRALEARDLRSGALPGAAAGYLEGMTVPSGSHSALDLQTELFDTASMYDPGEDLIQVPMNGTYLVTASVVTGSSSAQSQVRIVVGTDFVHISRNGNTVGGGPLTATAVLPLEAGDQVSVGTFSTDPLEVIDFTVDPDVPGVYLSVQMLSP